MAFFDRLTAAYGALTGKSAGAAASPSTGMLPGLGSTPSATGLNVSQGTALTSSPTYACVTVRGQDVARCRPMLVKSNSRGRKIEVTDHPVARFLRRPNDRQTWFEFAEQLTVGYLLKGNGYGVKRYDGRGRLRDVIPVNPDAAMPMEGYDGQIFYNVNRLGLWQMAMLREFPQSIAAEDMLHIRGLSLNSLVGLSTIGLARDAIGLAMGLEQQAARLMANGSRPSVVLLAKNRLGDETALRLKQQWRELTAGIANFGSTAVLEEGLEPRTLSLDAVDSDFMKQREHQVIDACRFWRVPPFKLGVVEMRGINIDQINQDYVNNTIMPDLHRIEQKLTQEFGLEDECLEIRLDESVLLRADITTRFAANRIALGGAAFATLNQVRLGEGWDEVPGGDEVTRPVNIATVGSDKTGTAPDGAGRPPASEGGVPGADHVAPAPKAEADDKALLAAVNRTAAEILEKAGLAL